MSRVGLPQWVATSAYLSDRPSLEPNRNLRLGNSSLCWTLKRSDYDTATFRLLSERNAVNEICSRVVLCNKTSKALRVSSIRVSTSAFAKWSLRWPRVCLQSPSAWSATQSTHRSTVKNRRARLVSTVCQRVGIAATARPRLRAMHRCLPWLGWIVRYTLYYHQLTL